MASELNDSPLADLPDAMLLDVVTKLDPYRILALGISLASTPASKVLNDPLLWQGKYKQHFPYLPPVPLYPQQTNWKRVVVDACNREYALLSMRQRRLLSLIKEGDLDTLKTMGLHRDDLLSGTGHSSLLYWAEQQKNQALRDYCYELASTAFRNEDQTLDATRLDEHQRSLLHYAIALRQPLAILAGLLDQQANPYARDNTTSTPMFVAARCGYLEAVQLLIARGASPLTARASDDVTPLSIAAQHGHINVVNELLAHHANPDVASIPDGITPLHMAVQYGHEDVVKRLLESGANPHAVSASDHPATPYSIALQTGNAAIIETLFGNQNQAQTALLVATENDHYDVIRTLLERGVNPDIIDPESGLTPFMVAVTHGNDSTVALLLQHGASPAVSLTDSAEHLQQFVEPCNPRIQQNMRLFINRCLENGADAAAITVTPWQMACILMHHAVCYRLQEQNLAPQGGGLNALPAQLFGFFAHDPQDNVFLNACFHGILPPEDVVLSNIMS